jgi:hypothetical protein
MPIERNFIEENLTLLSECDNSQDFVAIAIKVEGGLGYHSGLVICLDEQFYFFHYTGREVLMESLEQFPTDLYIKKLTIFEPSKVEYIKAFCEILQEEAHPRYGWIFTDSFYNGDGSYYSDEGLPDITTCVGFCINVIRGVLYNNEVYISTDDWDDSSFGEYQHGFMNMITEQLARLEEIDPDRLEAITQGTFKRIMPSELTSSGFCEELPIRKINVDPVNPVVVDVILGRNITS